VVDCWKLRGVYLHSGAVGYDRSIRVLHAFQALIYVAVVILALRRSARSRLSARTARPLVFIYLELTTINPWERT
jgi:hypothetical protein